MRLRRPVLAAHAESRSPLQCAAEQVADGGRANFRFRRSQVPFRGLEGAWTNHPTEWDNGFLENLYGWEWELTESPAGAKQWRPKNPEAQGTVPDAHDKSKRRHR